MDVLSIILNIAKPTGVWPTIIDAFESGVGSYLLAIVLITLILRVALSPFDVVNKKISKKQAAAQAKLKPELEKLQQKYGNDKALLNQKTSELYKKSGMSVGGSCLFMLVFMAVNLLVFFSLFSALNTIADYKINQQYLSMREGYTNVLNIVDAYGKDSSFVSYTNLLGDYENLTISKELVGEENYIVAYDQDGNEIYKTKQTTNFENYEQTTKTLSGTITDNMVSYNEGSQYSVVKVVEGEVETQYYILTEKINKVEDVYTLSEESYLYNYYTSDQEIVRLINKYVTKKSEEDTTYIGDQEIATDVTLSKAVQALGLKEVKEIYKAVQKENSFLWIGSIWVADAPFKNSVLTFDQYRNEIGKKNVSGEEATIYNSFMVDLRETEGRSNGYFILAIISIGVSFLASWLGQLSTKKKDIPNPKSNKIMLIVMPLIMGIFAVFYNAVFAIYLIVSQSIAAAITPLSNFIVKKWEEHDQKKEEKKAPVVDYRRK